ncbi:hypothetical protein TUBRATIS_000730 [Tubulinosema ratisbonensis]|uniref:Uncharacterized protein n=1 Tax=Tubulinosema ratisbonensis TaxID=291195 RepID=A0A437AQK0_9MICR|nr:hypothetical protein TUBRATIS_000730 [Tubulinosema ratisbonensis]
MHKSFKDKILNSWSKSLKAAINTIKEKFIKETIVRKTTKNIKTRKSARKRTTFFNPRRKPLKSNKGNKTVVKAKKNSILNQTIKVVDESEAQPVSVEILNKKESTFTGTGINDILQESENKTNLIKKEENKILTDEKINKEKKIEKTNFIKKVVERGRNNLKQSFLTNKFKKISEYDSNKYIPKTIIPEISHNDSMSLELGFDSPLWAKKPNLADLVNKQDHDFLEGMFKNPNPVDIVTMLPGIKDLSNDSPNKWVKK